MCYFTKKSDNIENITIGFAYLFAELPEPGLVAGGLAALVNVLAVKRGLSPDSTEQLRIFIQIDWRIFCIQQIM